MKEGDVRLAYVVWEITLKCNLACGHCGSRAGSPRTEELSTEEALDLIEQMASLGVEEVALIGGEAFLRPDWLQLAAAIVDSGMKCSMTTGGFGIAQRTAERMAEVGISAVSISVDGLEEVHDRLRGRRGSWQQCFKTMERLAAAGIPFGCNTQINRRTATQLPLLYEHLRAAGFKAWQLQLTVPMGNAADNDDMLLQPAELLELYPMLGELAQRSQEDGISLQAGNNVGYYGPYARLLRGRGRAERLWTGCKAGINTLGLEADGAIKGCPSLPTKPYTGGNIREHSLEEVVYNAPELTFNEDGGTDHLWGFCKGCDYAALCRGGCSWTSHVFFDKRGNNPYCHHRALTQAAHGLRERTVQIQEASGTPFDNGCFRLHTEPLNAPWDPRDEEHYCLEKVQWPTAWLEETPALTKQLQAEKERSIAVYRRRVAPDQGQKLASEAANLLQEGELTQAEALYKEAITCLEQEASDPWLLASSLNNLAGMMLQQQRLEAAPFAQRAANLFAQLSPESLEHVTSIGNLAAYGKLIKDYEAAEAAYRDVLSILERTEETPSLRVANLLTHLSEVIRQQGKHNEAFGPLQRSLQLYEELYGAEHPETEDMRDIITYHYGQPT